MSTITAREKVIGWYHTGPRLRESDLDIHALISSYCEKEPILLIAEVTPKDMGLPLHAYAAHEEIREDGTDRSRRVFINLPTEVGSTEAEEIGVEHLLRDVKDANISTLSNQIGEMMTGLRGLKSKLMEVKAYLAAVLDGRLPINHEIMRDLQEMFNLLPNLNVSELNRAFAVESNDMMLVIYVASLIRSVIALHNLIENKETRVAAEKKMAAMVVGSSKQIGVGGGDKENGNKENGTGDEKKKMDSGK
jgi:26S proteasome regulatory subunit N8